MITIIFNFPTHKDSIDIDVHIIDVVSCLTFYEMKVFNISLDEGKVILSPKDYVKYVGIEYIDDASNDVMDFIRDVTGMDSDSDEDDELYTTVHDMMKEFYEETEFVPYFETVEQGVELMNILIQNTAPNISKLEFSQGLHFDSQVPYFLIKDAVEEFHGY